jgi:hypothetical protein
MSASSTSFRFLDLPPELLIHVLCFLPLKTIQACSQSSRFLQQFIASSIELQYLIGREVTQVVDNPCSPLPISERVKMLRDRENAFNEAKPRWMRSIPVTFQPAGLYELSG